MKIAYQDRPPNNIVIPTAAYPDFLPRALDNAACAALRKESRINFVNAINLNRKSGVA